MITYKRVLNSLMSSVHRLEVGQDYELNVSIQTMTRQVTPKEMVRWLKLRTFGVPDLFVQTHWRFGRRRYLFTCRINYMDGVQEAMVAT